MPNGNINSDALDSLFDPKGNVVLEQFEDSAYGTTAVIQGIRNRPADGRPLRRGTGNR